MVTIIKRKMILAFTVVIIIPAIAGLMIFFAQNQLNPVSTPLRHHIVEDNITINADSYTYYDFSLSNNANVYPTVTGTFSVSSQETMERPLIRVFVMTYANFTAWQNHNTAGTIYDSAFVHNGTLSVDLPMNGDYVLVYDNTFDSISKIVNTTVATFQI
jgi:hypothetical protein